MATTDLIGAHERTETAALPPAAVAAMTRLEQALASRSTSDTLARLESASARYRRVATAPSVDFDSLLCAQDEVTMCRCQLAAAGRLDLIEVA